MKRITLSSLILIILLFFVSCNASVDEKLFANNNSSKSHAAKIEFADNSYGPYYIASQNSRGATGYSMLPLFIDEACTISTGYRFSFISYNNYWIGTNMISTIWTGTNASIQQVNGQPITIPVGTYTFTKNSGTSNITLKVYETLTLSIPSLPD